MCVCSDIEKIQAGIGDKMVVFLQNVSTFLTGYIFAFSINWKLALVVSSVLPVIAFLTFVYGKVYNGLLFLSSHVLCIVLMWYVYDEIITSVYGKLYNGLLFLSSHVLCIALMWYVYDEIITSVYGKLYNGLLTICVPRCGMSMTRS